MAPSDCVTGVVAAMVPVAPPDPEPETATVLLVDCVSGPVAEESDDDVEESCVPAGPVTLVGSGAVTDVDPVDVTVVSIVAVVVPVGAVSDVSSFPTTAVCTGGSAGAVICPVSVDPIVSDPDAETVAGSDGGPDEIVAPDVPSVGAEGCGSSDADCRCRAPVLGSAGDAFGADAAGAGAVPGAGAEGAGTTGVAGAVRAPCAAPTLFATTGDPEKRSTGVFVRAMPDAPALVREYESLTTGTVRRTVFVGLDVPAPAAFAARNGGSGASRCTVGARRSGNLAAGSVSVASGVVGPGIEGWRKAPMIGAAYIRPNTATPMPAHQYRIPRNRSAVKLSG